MTMTIVDALVLASLVLIVLGVGTVVGALLAILVLGTQAGLIHAIVAGVGASMVVGSRAAFWAAREINTEQHAEEVSE
jgi:hypothetical protein